MYGMKLSQLTPELIDEILDLYGNIGKLPKENIFWRRHRNGRDGAYHIREISYQLKTSNVAEWRYGSGLSGISKDHAKFEVWQAEQVGPYIPGEKFIRFVFDPNMNTVKGDEADVVRQEFRLAVEDLLKQKSLAVELR